MTIKLQRELPKRTVRKATFTFAASFVRNLFCIFLHSGLCYETYSIIESSTEIYAEQPARLSNADNIVHYT